MNWRVVASAIDAEVGETASEVSTAFVAVTVALEEMLPEVAEMVDEPTASAKAKPGVLLVFTETAVGLADVHWTEEVMSCVLPSVNVPTASSWAVVPIGSEVEDGDTLSEAREAAATVKVVLPLTPK